MATKKVLDLGGDLPSFEVIVDTEGRRVDVTIRDIYELAMEGADKGVPMKDRMGLIATKFNEKFDCSLDEDKMFILMTNGMEIIEEFVGNTDGSST